MKNCKKRRARVINRSKRKYIFALLGVSELTFFDTVAAARQSAMPLSISTKVLAIFPLLQPDRPYL